MLQQDEPDDYVVATGETHSLADFLDAAFEAVGISDWSNLVYIDPKFYRPAEVDYLLGIPTKAENELGWERNKFFRFGRKDGEVRCREDEITTIQHQAV